MIDKHKSTKLNSSKYCYVSPIQLNISHLFTHSVMVIVVGNGRRHEFKSWTRLIAFHIVLIPLGKV